jgi:hypothetical protein
MMNTGWKHLILQDYDSIIGKLEKEFFKKKSDNRPFHSRTNFTHKARYP